MTPAQDNDAAKEAGAAEKGASPPNNNPPKNEEAESDAAGNSFHFSLTIEAGKADMDDEKNEKSDKDGKNDAAPSPSIIDVVPVEVATPEIKPDIFQASPSKKPEDVKPAAAAKGTDSDTAAPLPGNNGGNSGSTLALAALLVAGVAMLQPLWAPYLPGFAPKPATMTVQAPAASAQPVPSQPDPAIQADLKALADKLAALENGLAAKAPAPAITATSGEDPRVDGLKAELAALKAQLASVAEQQAAAAKAATTKPTAPALGSLSPAVALAVGRLQADITLGQPFTASLKGLRDTAGGDAAIAAAADTLQPLAGAGVATLPVLLARFNGLGSDIIRAAHRGEGADWMDKVGGTLATLVTVRRYGNDIQGDSVEAVTGRAEEALNAGKLDQAVAELSGLTGPAAAAAAPWLGAAKARLTADLAAKTIADRAFALLAAAEKGGNAQ